MKFKVGDKVRNKASGSTGTIVSSEYEFRVKDGSTYESTKYFIKWDIEAKRLLWVKEEDLMPYGYIPNIDAETDIMLINVQIDKALDDRDKESFLYYSKELNKLLNKVDVK